MGQEEESAIGKGEDGVAEGFATFQVRIISVRVFCLKQCRIKRQK